jgi:hypothetical protein
MLNAVGKSACNCMSHGVTGLDLHLSRTLYLSKLISTKLKESMKGTAHVTENRNYSVE